MTTTKQNIPELRFPGFEGEWVEYKIEDTINFLTDYHANGSYEKLKENVELLDNKNYAIMIRTTNFEKKDFKNNFKYITKSAYSYLKKSQVHAGDIIINKIANAGATYFMPDLNYPVSLGMNIFLMRCKSNFNSKYIYMQIKTKEFWLRSLSSGTGTKTITKQDVKTFLISCPILTEQKKIASFVSSIDTKINILTKKKELMEQYKKGIMQKIFSQEIRFKDDNGNDYPDWEVKRLGDKIELIPGYAFKSNLMSNSPSDYQLLKMSNVYMNTLQLERNPSYWSNKNKFDEKYLLRSEDVILTLTGTVNKRDYGYSVFIKDDHKYLINQRLVCLRSKKISGNFIQQLLKTKYFLYKFFSTSKGGTGNQTNVSTQDLKEILLSFPSLNEQQKIAIFLSSIDNKLSLMDKELTSVKEFKKGLLQKMFV